MTRPALALLFAASAGLAACGKTEDAPAPTRSPPPTARDQPAAGSPPMFADTPAKPAPASPAEEARQIWASACQSCHGETGQGDGPTGRMLRPPPRDHSDPAWQASVTDEHIAKVIVGGGAAVGKSSVMPARPDLAEKPEVLAALVELIRGFKAP